MAYNTFNNVLDTEKEIQCIICLEQTPSLLNENDNVTLLNDMHFLTKECECLCYAHHKCIEKWITTNAVCPICKKTLAFPRMTVKNHNAVIIELPRVTQNTTTTTSHMCISIVISMFFVLVILQIIVRY